MTLVVNVKHYDFDVYIGRPTKWGNPYTHLERALKKGMTLVGSREEAVERYREWAAEQFSVEEIKAELRGKVLGCWCKPLACHGDVLKEIADS